MEDACETVGTTGSFGLNLSFAQPPRSTAMADACSILKNECLFMLKTNYKLIPVLPPHLCDTDGGYKFVH